MKTKLIFLFLIVKSVFFSQETKTAVFGDGVELNYQILSNNAKDIRKLNVWLFDLNTRSTFSAGTSIAYSIPNVFLSKFHIGNGYNGLGRVSLENTIFFKTYEKTRKYGITLKTITNGDFKTKFKVWEPLVIRRQLAARLGYLRGDFRGDLYQFSDEEITFANELSIGFSYVNTKFYRIKNLSSGKPRIASKMGRTSYYAEFLHYNNVLTDNGKVDNRLGYRIALDGQIGGRFGMSYTFGFEKPPLKDSFFDVFFGFGMYLAFF
jgi:hypothetical protein